MWGSEVKTKPVEVQIFFHLNGVFQQGEEVTEVYLQAVVKHACEIVLKATQHNVWDTAGRGAAQEQPQMVLVVLQRDRVQGNGLGGYGWKESLQL